MGHPVVLGVVRWDCSTEVPEVALAAGTAHWVTRINTNAKQRVETSKGCPLVAQIWDPNKHKANKEDRRPNKKNTNKQTNKQTKTNKNKKRALAANQSAHNMQSLNRISKLWCCMKQDISRWTSHVYLLQMENGVPLVGRTGVKCFGGASPHFMLYVGTHQHWKPTVVSRRWWGIWPAWSVLSWRREVEHLWTRDQQRDCVNSLRSILHIVSGVTETSVPKHEPCSEKRLLGHLVPDRPPCRSSPLGKGNRIRMMKQDSLPLSQRARLFAPSLTCMCPGDCRQKTLSPWRASPSVCSRAVLETCQSRRTAPASLDIRERLKTHIQEERSVHHGSSISGNAKARWASTMGRAEERDAPRSAQQSSQKWRRCRSFRGSKAIVYTFFFP